MVAITDVPAGNKQWQGLFHQDELNANPAIVQNPLEDFLAASYEPRASSLGSVKIENLLNIAGIRNDGFGCPFFMLRFD